MKHAEIISLLLKKIPSGTLEKKLGTMETVVFKQNSFFELSHKQKNYKLTGKFSVVGTFIHFFHLSGKGYYKELVVMPVHISNFD